MDFESLDLNDDILDALYDMRFEQCTPIQEACIPKILSGKDLLGVAQTGTGKTAAFLLPILSKIADGKLPQDAINCLIMSPTRELAQQIDQAAQGFSYYLDNVSCVAIYGGNDGNRYEQELKSLTLGANIIIATPGRFISHISMGNVDLSKASFFILDEADRMLDMGFLDDILKIARKLPTTCQTIMFSATMPDKIEKLAKSILKKPEVVKLSVSRPAEKINQKAFVCYELQKIKILEDLFRKKSMQRVIIFSGSKQKVKQIHSALSKLNIKCGQMHSDLDQSARDEIMFKFKSGQIDALVATDIIARGIDIDDIAMVINYDVPRDAEDYIHRIGRTARADKDGAAITFIEEKDIRYFKQIEKVMGKTVEKLPLPSYLKDQPAYTVEESRKPSYRNKQNKGAEKYKKDTKPQRNKPNKEGREETKSSRANSRQGGKSKKENTQVAAQKTKQPLSSLPIETNKQSKEKTVEGNIKPQKNKPAQQKEKKKQKEASKHSANNAPRKDKAEKRKHKNRNKHQSEPTAQRSTKYDIGGSYKPEGASESKLKDILLKPIKWLKKIGK